MPIPNFHTVIASVLDLSETEMNYKEATEKIASRFNLTDEEKAETIKNDTRRSVLKNRIEWSVSYLYQAGLVSRTKRGYFQITPEGKTVQQQHLEQIDAKYLAQFPSFADFMNRKRGKTYSSNKDPVSSEDVSILTPEETMTTTYQEITNELKDELLNRILTQSAGFFEQLVIDLLRAMGYGSSDNLAEAIGRSGDGGVDGVIHQDRLGLDVVYVQAKRYEPSNKVGRPDLQKFIGSLSGFSANKGVFITTSAFSSNVADYLRSVQQRVVVIDGERLVELLIQHGVGVRPIQTYTLYRVDEDFFSE